MPSLTVRHIGDDGREAVVPCVRAEFDPTTSVLRLLGPDGLVVTEFTGGRAYVMSDGGDTVATYRLPRHAAAVAAVEIHQRT